MNRRKGYSELEYEAAMRHKRHRKMVRRLEAATIIGVFSGLVFVIYYALWMWANGYIGG